MQQNNIVNPIDTVLGLAGKAIGGSISGAKARKQEQAQQEAEDRERREEEDREYEERKAASDAARHEMTLEVECPVCDAKVSASMASDGRTKVRCKQCKTRLEISHSGKITVLGPKGEELSKAESLQINENRLCSKCRFLRTSSRGITSGFFFTMIPFLLLYAGGFFIWPYWGWAIVGGILALIATLFFGFIVCGFAGFFSDECKNRDACAVTDETGPSDINPNFRCTFWEKK